jgi:hypothetical protein
MQIDPAVWAFIGVVIGGLVTGGVTLWAAKIQTDGGSRLDSAKRQDDRQLHRDNIQRETLLELQPRLAEWLRAMALGFMADRKALRTSGALGRRGDELSAAELETTRKLMYLTERVKDEELRAALTALRSDVAGHQVQHSMRDAHVTEATIVAAENEMAFQAQAVSVQLGEVLRRYL